jgi:peptide-methionine (S)-S-oxide reductase
VSWFEQVFGRPAKSVMVTPEAALRGRDRPLPLPGTHFVNGHPLAPPFPDALRTAVVAMGCFWGAEKQFWQLPGVYTTAVGYTGGYTPNPSYDEVCSGRTGHTESVLVVFDPARLSYTAVLREFWENHDPTQGMRQGNDHGTQYRSAIFTTDEEQAALARDTRDAYARRLSAAGYGAVTTEISALSHFYYAEGYHQQYLAKNPNGYCPVHATGVSCPVGR